MRKVINLSLVLMVVLNACTSNKFLKQRYTNFKNNRRHSQPVASTTPSKVEIPKPAEFRVNNTVHSETPQKIMASAQKMPKKEDITRDGIAGPSTVIDPQAAAPTPQVRELNEKQIAKKEQKKFIFGLLSSLLELILFILVIVLVVLLILALV